MFLSGFDRQLAGRPATVHVAIQIVIRASLNPSCKILVTSQIRLELARIGARGVRSDPAPCRDSS